MDKVLTCSMSRAAPQLCWLITHLTLWRRWSLWMDTTWWKCLDSDWELCSRTLFCVKTLQERLMGECVTGNSCLCFSGDSLVISLDLLKSNAERRWCGVSEMQTFWVFCVFSYGVLVVSACGHFWGPWAIKPSSPSFCSLLCAVWVCGLLSDTSESPVQVMTGASLAGRMGRWQSVMVGNQGVKTGGVRQGKDSRSFSVCSNSELSPAADPGWQWRTTSSIQTDCTHLLIIPTHDDVTSAGQSEGWQ